MNYKQLSLDGREAGRAECEYYDGCRGDALYIAEILHTGEGEKPVKMCESCADEHLEVGDNEVQRLKPEERYKRPAPQFEEKATTVWVVAANYADDPHPHVEGVYASAAAAEKHSKDIRDDIRPSAPIAWQVFEMEVSGDE